MLSIECEKFVYGRFCLVLFELNREVVLNFVFLFVLFLYRKCIWRFLMDGRVVFFFVLLLISLKIIVELGFGSLEKGLEVELFFDLRFVMWKKFIIGM